MSYSSPQMLGRPTSPLNPHHASSSSPLTSPTPMYNTPKSRVLQPFSPGSPSSSKLHRTRYTRPVEAKRAASYPLGPVDLFTEGTTPMEGAMWRERFTRRMEERERRMRVRDGDLRRRRNQGDGEVDEEEADRRAQADDEEVGLAYLGLALIRTDPEQIFRRLMVLQRSRARHAQLVALKDETGGSEPDVPDFWEDGQLTRQSSAEGMVTDDVRMISPSVWTPRADMHRDQWDDEEEERWAREAAEAEEAEYEAEELDILKKVEEAYGIKVLGRERNHNGDLGMEMD